VSSEMMGRTFKPVDKFGVVSEGNYVVW